jgi:hypothetical protein
MPIPSTIADLSPTAGSNSPAGGESPTEGDNHIRALAAITRQVYDAAALSITTGYLTVNGSTVPANGVYLSAANTVGLASNTTLRWSVNSTGNHVFAAPSSGATLALNVLASTDSVTWTDGTVSGKLGTIAATSIFFGAGSNHNLQLRTNNSDRISIANSGNVTIAAPSSGIGLAVTGVANTAAVSASTGVSVGNSANTSGTVLDWYEENTFTPAGIAGSPTYSSQVGTFTRIGNKVDFLVYLIWTGGTNGSSISITGLPYTASSAGNFPVSIIVNNLNASFTWTGTVVAYVGGGTTSVLCNVINTGSSAASLTNPNAGTKDLMISGHYFV